MNIVELIDAAKKRKGSMHAVAAGIKMDQTRLSDWKAGRRKPDANEVLYLADVAGLPVLETLADVAGQLDPRYAEIWKRAVSELRQNQG
jgi:transcriptional regulator with XRE-family HTH domain